MQELNPLIAPTLSPAQHLAKLMLVPSVLQWGAGTLAVVAIAVVSASAGYGAGLSGGLRVALIEARHSAKDGGSASQAISAELRQLNASAERLAAAFERAIPPPDPDR